MHRFIMALVFVLATAGHASAEYTERKLSRMLNEIEDALGDSNYAKAKPLLWEIAHLEQEELAAGCCEDFNFDVVQNWTRQLLGWAYLYGQGVQRNERRAKKFLEQAGAAGYHYLGHYYYDFANDKSQAKKYWELSVQKKGQGWEAAKDHLEEHF